MAAGEPPAATRYTRAGPPVPRKTSPFGATDVVQTALEGVVATSLKAGASWSSPLLEIATPCAVPLEKSSYLFCSQVRVPSANARIVISETEASRRAPREVTRLSTGL